MQHSRNKTREATTWPFLLFRVGLADDVKVLSSWRCTVIARRGMGACHSMGDFDLTPWKMFPSMGGQALE